MPELAQKCIESWRKFCPDYEIIEWNETNYDITKNNYMHQAYENKKWAFVSDYARLDVVYNYGGIYLDTDVELIKPIDSLLEHEAFAGVEQNSEYVALGLGFGACERDTTIRAILNLYDNLEFIKDGKPDLTPAPQIHTKAFYSLGYKYSSQITTCATFTIYTSEYFCPINYDTNEITITDNTYSIHHYTASWYGEQQKYAQNLRRKYAKIMPRKMAAIFATAVAKTKYDGLDACLKWIFKKRR